MGIKRKRLRNNPCDLGNKSAVGREDGATGEALRQSGRIRGWLEHLTALPHPLMAYAGGDSSGLGRGLARCPWILWGYVGSRTWDQPAVGLQLRYKPMMVAVQAEL